MELRQLEYFVAVAEEANFTRAAERVHISQSGVSAQVRRLERELGVTLVDRSSRVATLTDAGEAVLGPARAALAAVGGVRQAADEVSALVRGRLAVGMVTACTVTPLFDALAGFHLAHPGVEVSLREDRSDRLVDDVRAGVLDLALVAWASAPPADLEAFSVVSERLVACVPVDHPLAGRSRVTLADLAAHPILALPQGTGIRTVLDRGCAAAGIRPTVVVEASAPGAVADLAVRGLGVAVLSESMVAGYEGRLEGLVIDDIEMPAVLALVWRSPVGPALGELVRACRARFAPPAQEPTVSSR